MLPNQPSEVGPERSTYCCGVGQRYGGGAGGNGGEGGGLQSRQQPRVRCVIGRKLSVQFGKYNGHRSGAAIALTDNEVTWGAWAALSNLRYGGTGAMWPISLVQVCVSLCWKRRICHLLVSSSNTASQSSG